MRHYPQDREAHHREHGVRAERASEPANYEIVRALVADKVDKTKCKITAKRLLAEAVAAGYAGSDRNFRRLVAQEKKAWRRARAAERQRRRGVRAPGEYLVIDWGVLGGLHVFCAVLAFSRVRFIRFADNERADTTLGFLAECFETLGGIPQVVLADRMGLPEGRRRRGRGDPDAGLRPVRDALLLPP